MTHPLAGARALEHPPLVAAVVAHHLQVVRWVLGDDSDAGKGAGAAVVVGVRVHPVVVLLAQHIRPRAGRLAALAGLQLGPHAAVVHPRDGLLAVLRLGVLAGLVREAADRGVVEDDLVAEALPHDRGPAVPAIRAHHRVDRVGALRGDPPELPPLILFARGPDRLRLVEGGDGVGADVSQAGLRALLRELRVEPPAVDRGSGTGRDDSQNQRSQHWHHVGRFRSGVDREGPRRLPNFQRAINMRPQTSRIAPKLRKLFRAQNQA